MISYIWLNDEKPILSQVKNKFKSAAILTNPFIYIPIDKVLNCDFDSDDYYYPSHKEILELGKAISWKDILDIIGLTSFNELAIALKTSISALNKKYRREDLAYKLNDNLKDGIFYPNEDIISEFIIRDIIEFFRDNGFNKLYFSNPITSDNGYVDIYGLNPVKICELYDKEILISNENFEYVFMSIYDSFITILLCKKRDAKDVVTKMGWEGFICKDNTLVNWYLDSNNFV